MRFNWNTFKDSVTLLLAVVGAVLGVINTVVASRQRKLKLRVQAKYALMVGPVGTSGRMGSIEVTNLSSFPVYLSEIGFELIGRSDRLVITQPITTDHQPFARKLDSHQCVSGYFELDAIHKEVAGKCYVRTESGQKFFGNRLP